MCTLYEKCTRSWDVVRVTTTQRTSHIFKFRHNLFIVDFLFQSLFFFSQFCFEILFLLHLYYTIFFSFTFLTWLELNWTELSRWVEWRKKMNSLCCFFFFKIWNWWWTTNLLKYFFTFRLLMIMMMKNKIFSSSFFTLNQKWGSWGCGCGWSLKMKWFKWWGKIDLITIGDQNRGWRQKRHHYAE